MTILQTKFYAIPIVTYYAHVIPSYPLQQAINIHQPFQRGDRLYTSKSDVCRRQILTYKDGSHNERNKIFIMVVDP